MLTEYNINGVNDSSVFQVTVHHITVGVKVVAVHVRILVSVESGTWVKAVGGFPLVRHFILVGVFEPRRGEVAFTKDLSNLVFFEVVHTVFVPISVAIRGVGWVEHIGGTWCHGCVRVTEFETIGHTVTVRVPIRWAVEKTVPVHVHEEPVSLNAKEWTNVRQRVKEWLIAVLTQSGVKTDGDVGNLNDVVDEVLVRISCCRVGSKRFLFKVSKAIIISVQNHVAGMATVRGEVVPFCHTVFAVEPSLKGIDHGLVEEKTVPVTVQRVEQHHFATRRLNAGRVERFPAVVQAVVIGVCTLWVCTEFLFGLVGESVSVRVTSGALTWVWPRICFILNLCITGIFVLCWVYLQILGFPIV